MKSLAMNTVIELVKKDFSIYSKMIFIYAVLTLLGLGIMAIPNEIAAHFGVIVVITIFVSFYCHIIITAVVKEKKDSQLTLLMTLPVSLKNLLRIKIVSVLLIVLSIWVPMSLLTYILISSLELWPAVSLAFFCCALCLFLPCFGFIILISVLTYSEGYAILALVSVNVIMSLTFNFLPKSKFMGAAYEKGNLAEAGIVWPPEFSQLILVFIVIFVIEILASFLFANTRRAFFH